MFVRSSRRRRPGRRPLADQAEDLELKLGDQRAAIAVAAELAGVDQTDDRSPIRPRTSSSTRPTTAR